MEKLAIAVLLYGLYRAARGFVPFYLQRRAELEGIGE